MFETTNQIYQLFWCSPKGTQPSDHAGRDFSCIFRAVTPIESQFLSGVAWKVAKYRDCSVNCMN